ncbi:MAG: PEP-CTERM sorting domain-containing protein [Nostoc sp.]|uniref:PEP-CTERM sorting domain-containing protein n=1 Tax=Nostoc sp. TaxID=1180 RepID=UPI002FEF5315
MHSIEHSSTPILKNLLFKGLATIALVVITSSVSNTPTSAASLIDDNPDSNSLLSGNEGISDNAQSPVSHTLLTSDNYNNTAVVPGLNNYFAETNSIVNSTPSLDIHVTQSSEPILLNEPNTLPGLFVLTGFTLLLCRKNTKDDDKFM